VPPHNDNDAKHDEVSHKKRKFEWLNDTSVLAISLLCFAAALLVFCVIMSRWQRIASAKTEMLSAEPVEVAQQHREGDNSDNRNYRDEKDRKKKGLGQWKILVSYEDATCGDDNGLGGDHCAPKKMGAGQLPFLVSPQLNGSASDLFTGRGYGFVVIWFRVHCDSPPNPKNVPAK
jgi:hypothetical protein